MGSGSNEFGIDSVVDQYDNINDNNNDYSEEEEEFKEENLGITESSNNEVYDDENEVVVIERVEIGSRKINASEKISDNESINKSEELKRNKGEKNKKFPSICLKNRRRVSHLDKLELDTALKNTTDSEFNIRNLLNYR